MKKILCFLLIALLLLGGLAGCKKEPEPELPAPVPEEPEVPAPERVVEALEQACNDLDIKSVLQCIDPAKTKGIQAALDVMGLFASDEQIIQQAASMLIEDTDLDPVEVCRTISISPLETEMEEETATVKALVVFESDGVAHEGNVLLEFICEDGTWYIAGGSYERE